MSPPDLISPNTLEEALEALRARGAVALAGATDLIPAMHRGESQPRLLVNLKRIPGLAGIRRVRGGVRVGAATLVTDLIQHRAIGESFPIMVEVGRGFGSPLIRNLATIGGNLCNAAPSADFALPFLVLDARAEIRGRGGERELDLSEFFRGVNRTALARGEVLTAIFIPRPPVRTGAAHAKLGVRRAMDLPVVGAAAALSLAPDGRRCRQARIALGAVAPIPMRARKAEGLLEGRPVTAAVLKEAAAAAAAAARPVTDLRAGAEYRRDMVQVLTERVLRRALRRAQGKE
jgi:CO/xanthine dehydrogenase FAD-binding subunit